MSDINEEIKVQSKETERRNRQEEKYKFNTATKSEKVVNQNQTYNANKEGLGPNARR